jgi:hypothetical protein
MEGHGRLQWGLKMRRAGSCRPMVADLHHCDEEQDPDPDPHQSEHSDPDPNRGEKMGIRICTTVEKFARYNF